MLRHFSSTTFAALALSLTAAVAQGWSIGTDAVAGGPEAVCFIVGGHPAAGDTSGKIQVEYLCSGTLIAPDEVLTAAHCATPLKEDPKMQLKVMCGYQHAPAAGQSISTAFKEVYSRPASM